MAAPFASGALNPGAELTPDQVEFGLAMERRQRELGRRVPAHDARQVLAVARRLGYALPAEQQKRPAARRRRRGR